MRKLPTGVDGFKPSRTWGFEEHNLCIEANNRHAELERVKMRSEVTPEVSEREGRWERYLVGRAMRLAKKSTD